MILRDFFNTYEGNGVDFDGYYGDQCVDIVQFYNKDIIGAPILTGNAKDIWNTYPKGFYTQIPNLPNNYPQVGDIVIWDGGVGSGNGHIAIAGFSNVWALATFDQNWIPGDPCKFVNHNYNNIIGWLRPNNQPQL
jgi:hypothetical protein